MIKYQERLEYHLKRAKEKGYDALTVETKVIKKAYRDLMMEDRKDYCINCKHYDLDYQYCKNKESDYYQLEMGYKDECEKHDRGKME